MLLCTAQLATWIPHYLTRPWFADHDVFATLALGWGAGMPPYRDLAGNNFPGTIYVFWILGHLFGGGRTAPFYAFDAALVVALGVAMGAWSRRRFASALPGVAGYASFLSYYLSLPLPEAAQRDWHGPMLMVLGLMAAESASGRAGRLASALCAALAFAVRPQVVLLLPAMAIAVATGKDRETGKLPDRVRSLMGWGLVSGVFAALAFAPLIAAGVLPDLARGVRLTSYGTPYNQVGPATFLKQMLLQAMSLKFLIVPAAILTLRSPGDPASRRSVAVWLTALAGASLYKPLSPVPFSYLTHPLVLVWSMNVAVLVHLATRPALASPSVRLVLVLLTLGLGVDVRPRFCSLQQSLRALADLRRGSDPEVAPPGFYPTRELDGRTTDPPYRWEDYRAALAYLRKEVPREVRVANLLRVVPVPAITGPSGRLPALPAESLAWLKVDPGAEEAFAEALERAEDAVVVWSPREDREGASDEFAHPMKRLAPIVRRHYEPGAKFGVIEVWRRRKRA